MANSARLGGLVGLAGLTASPPPCSRARAKPAIGAPPVFVLVSLSLVVGLSTAASP